MTFKRIEKRWTNETVTRICHINLFSYKKLANLASVDIVVLLSVIGDYNSMKNHYNREKLGNTVGFSKRIRLEWGFHVE